MGSGWPRAFRGGAQSAFLDGAQRGGRRHPMFREACLPGCVSFFWSDGCGATGPPVEEVGPSVVFDAAFGGEQGVGARFRPAAP